MATLKFVLKDKSEGPCDFADFSDFSRYLTDALRRVYRSKVATGELPRYRVIWMKVGSLAAEVMTEHVDVPVIPYFVDTVRAIRELRRPPIDVTGDDLRAFRHLTDPLDSHTKSIEIEDGIPIDDQFRAGCDYLLASCPRSFGSAIGRLDGLNIHNQKYFRMYPEGVEKGAMCYFPIEMFDCVVANISKRVRVEGTIHRDPDGIGIDRITDITKLESIPESSELPSLSSLFGLYKDRPLDLCRGWDG